MTAQDNLQPQQLKMFMSPDEIIDSTHKLDSGQFHPKTWTSSLSPREQWERPDSSWRMDQSLRGEKLANLEDSRHRFDRFDKPLATMPPVEISHKAGEAIPALSDGHHRLAHAEDKKVPFLAVKHGQY